MGLMGSYRHKLDAKGRLSLPSNFRKSLSKDLVVTLSPKDDSLNVFGRKDFAEWVESIFDKRGGYDPNDNEHVWLRKQLNARAKEAEIDGSGRLSISASQREAVGLDKDVVLVGDNDHFEIWDAKRWDEYSTMGTLADALYGKKF